MLGVYFCLYGTIIKLFKNYFKINCTKLNIYVKI